MSKENKIENRGKPVGTELEYKEFRAKREFIQTCFKGGLSDL